jgi:membrane protein
MLYGLFADPQTVLDQSKDLTQALPDDAASLLTTQMQAIVNNSGSALGLGLLIGLVGALWSASGGVGNMVTAINIAYDEEETRGFVKRKLLSLGLTLGAIVFAVVAIGLIAVVPILLEQFIDSSVMTVLLQVARWLGLLVAVSIGLAVLYRFAPDRDAPKFAWVSIGAGVATVLWLIASLGFSLYVNNFGSYGKTYGALAGVIVLLLWLFITVYVVLLGAEINAEAEQQTARDTTQGAEQPLGQRGAIKADALPEEGPEIAKQRQSDSRNKTTSR